MASNEQQDHYILDGFLSWKMVSELQKAGKFWVFLRKKAS